MRRTAVIALLLLAGAAAGAWWFQPQLTASLGLGPRGAAPQGQRTQPQQRPPAPVEVVTAATGRVADQVEALGTLAANESVSVAPEVAGRITAFRFTEGETVEQGAVLVELDATIARAEQEQARAALALAEDVFERNRTLVQRGAGRRSISNRRRRSSPPRVPMSRPRRRGWRS